jgi:hypothetical protein
MVNCSSSSRSLNQFQLDSRKSARVCPVCRDRGTGLFELIKNVRVDHEEHKYMGSYWVCSNDRDHNHYYLSEGGANSGPRERTGSVPPPAALAEYTGTRIIRRQRAA